MSDATDKLHEIVGRADVIAFKLRGIISDLELISWLMDQGCGTVIVGFDNKELYERIENMAAAVTEMRIGLEMSAGARMVEDSEYEAHFFGDEDDDDAGEN